MRIVSHEVQIRVVCGQIDSSAVRGKPAVAARGYVLYIGVCLRGSISLREAEDADCIVFLPLVVKGAGLDAAGHLQGDTGVGLHSLFVVLASRQQEGCQD